MTEHEPDDTRAEQALREALAAHADEVDSGGLVVSKRTSKPRWRWLAVAAAVLAVAMVGALSIHQLNSSDNVLTASSDSSPASTANPSIRTASGPLPAPMDGFQWVSSRDVAVQVPADWGYAMAPWFTNYCGKGPAQPKPYYSTFTGSVPRTLVACGPDLTRADDTLHLRMIHGDPEVPIPDWYRVVEVHGTHIAVAVPSGNPEDLALAEKILATVTVFTVDQWGCTPRSPIDALHWARPADPFDVTTLTDLESAVVCQYARPSYASDDQDGARLVASAPVPLEDARAMVTAIRQAPPGSPRTGACGNTPTGNDGFVLLLTTASGQHQLFAYFDDCLGGIDDGVTVRGVTPGWCRVLALTDLNPVMVLSMGIRTNDACGFGTVPAPTPTPTR